MASKSDESASRPKDARIPNIMRDPCLPHGLSTKPLEYMDVFVDNFLALAQASKLQKSGMEYTV